MILGSLLSRSRSVSEMNLKAIKKLAAMYSTAELEAYIHQIEEQYFEAPPDRQAELLDAVGDYLKALDVRLQIEQNGIDETTALRNLASRMRLLSAHAPYSEWFNASEQVSSRT